MIAGLLPAKRRGMKVIGEKCKHVFLTNDIDYIIKYQCGDKWIKKYDCVVLHVDTTDLEIKPLKIDGGMTYTLSNNEFVIDRISPEKIIKVAEL